MVVVVVVVVVMMMMMMMIIIIIIIIIIIQTYSCFQNTRRTANNGITDIFPYILDLDWE
jgi:hypothetical protein